MVQGAEAVGYVALDDPDHAFPGVVDFSQDRVASSPLAETMRVFAERHIKVRAQDHSHNLSKKLVAPDGHAERPLFPVFLGYVRSSRWLPLVSFLPHCLNDVVDFLQ